MRADRSEPSLFEENAALQARNRELSAFAHTVSHELKAPLSLVIATADAIVHITDLTPEELRAYLDQIRSTAHAMNHMIDNLLLFSEPGEADLPVARLGMAEILSHVQARLASLINEHDARINSRRNWPAATGYAPWVEEVWANLISNAIKYGGRPPVVDLGAATRRDGMVVFWARDNGLGIPPAAQANVFKPFSQFGPVRTPGHGLGLSIARRMAERLGGQMGFETELGRGSRFYFTLPAYR